MNYYHPGMTLVKFGEYYPMTLSYFLGTEKGRDVETVYVSGDQQSDEWCFFMTVGGLENGYCRYFVEAGGSVIRENEHMTQADYKLVAERFMVPSKNIKAKGIEVVAKNYREVFFVG
ncbi:hypothetical protein ABW20_dc0100918 [Dactylellina cionopaga]|nr:hypothetical protein ABW20_dc0100918 [Dactylellina cionopaga]